MLLCKSRSLHRMLCCTPCWVCNHGPHNGNVHQAIIQHSLHGNCIPRPKASSLHFHFHHVIDSNHLFYSWHKHLYFYCSMFCLLFLHLFLYGCNIFIWKKARINYSFIFELAPTKELKYREVFLICTASMTAVLGVLFIHLSLVAKGYSSKVVQSIPGFLLLVISQIALLYAHASYANWMG